MNLNKAEICGPWLSELICTAFFCLLSLFHSFNCDAVKIVERYQMVDDRGKQCQKRYSNYSLHCFFLNEGGWEMWNNVLHLVTSVLMHWSISVLHEQILSHLWKLGYSTEDIITNIFRVCKTIQMAEYLKLEYLKVSFLWKHLYMIEPTVFHVLGEWSEHWGVLFFCRRLGCVTWISWRGTRLSSSFPVCWPDFARKPFHKRIPKHDESSVPWFFFLVMVVS